jgi:hypothetical protein
MEIAMFFRNFAVGGAAMAALVMCGAIAVAASQADFKCNRKVVAIYRPGPHWSQFKERLSDHLDYVKAQIDAKAMAYGSPLSDQSGQPVGGLFVYDIPSIEEIEQRVQTDAFVRDQIALYSLAFWGMCSR